MYVGDTNKATKDDKYPWLDKDDIRKKNMSDRDVTEWKLILKKPEIDKRIMCVI